MTRKKKASNQNLTKMLASAIAASTLLIPSVANATDYTIDGTNNTAGVAAGGGGATQMTITGTDAPLTGSWNAASSDTVTMTGGTLDVSGYDGTTTALTNGIITATGGAVTVSGGTLTLDTGSAISAAATLAVNSGATLLVNDSTALAVDTTNAGTVTFTGGTITNGITGTGVTEINSTGTVDFADTTTQIAQDIEVNAGTLKLNGGNVNHSSSQTIKMGSGATLELTGGTLTTTLGGLGNGSVNVTGDTTLTENDSMFSQTVGDLTIASGKTLTTTGTTQLVIRGNLSNGGTIKNSGEVWFRQTGAVTNAGAITGTSDNSEVVLDSLGTGVTLTNTGTITGSNIKITADDKLITAADKVTDKDGTIVNNGTLELNGGTSATATVTGANATSGSGKIIIDGFVNQTGALNTTNTDIDAIKVNSGKYLKTSANNLGGVTKNYGTLELTGGTIAHGINWGGTGMGLSTNGTVQLTGDTTLADGKVIGADSLDLGSNTLTLVGHTLVRSTNISNNGSIVGTAGDNTDVTIGETGVTQSITNLVLTNIKELTLGGTITADASKITGTNATDVKLYQDAVVNLTNTGTNPNTSNFSMNGSSTNGKVVIDSTMSNTGSFTTTDMTISSGKTFTTDASKLATTNAVDNQGALNLTGGTLGADITDSQSTKTGAVSISGDVTSAKNITQTKVTVKSGTSSNDNILTVTGGTITAPVEVENYAGLSNAGTITGAVTLDAAGSKVQVVDAGTISGGIAAASGGIIGVSADTANASLSQAGTITGTGYTVFGASTGSNVATINQAITNAAAIDIYGASNVVITDAAYTSTSAGIVADNGATLTLDNTTSGSKTVGSTISASSASDTYDLNITNSGAGTTVIGAAVTGADDVNVKTGTTQFNADVTSAKLTVDNGATLQSDASHLKTSSNVDNQGTLVLTGTGTTGQLSTGVTDSQSTKTGTVEIGVSGTGGTTVTTNGHSITQTKVTVKQGASAFSKNNLIITAGDTVAAPVEIEDSAYVNNYGTIADSVTLDSANSILRMSDNASSVTGGVASTGGTIEVLAAATDASLSQITGDLTGSYVISAAATGSNTAIIDKAISGATAVHVASSINAKITDAAYTTTTAAITAGNNSTITLDNTTSASKTVGSTISAGGPDTYDLNIVNSNSTAGTTVIGANVTKADDVNVKSGTATFDANVTSNNLTVDSGTTLNVNSGKTASGNLANSGTVNNSGTLSGTIDNKTATSKLTTATSGLTNSANIKNDGTITFNDTAAAGTIAQSIGKSTTAGGIVEIAGGANTVISLAAGKTITDNALKLTSGTFDATNMADSSYNIDLSSLGTGLIGNGGTLSTQDGHAGTITLGNVDLSSGNVNLAIDLDLVGDGNKGAADNFTRTGTITSGTGKLNFSNIVLTADAGSLTEDNIKIADNTINTSDLSLGQTTISGTNIGNLLLTFTSDSEGTYLHTAHSDLTNAIKSTIVTKAYNMTANESIANPLTLGGTSLSITGNGKTISGADPTAKGVTIGTAAQTLTINNATVTGFTTAIDNTIGGTVNLNGVTMTGNTTADVHNAGTGNLNLDGTNSIDIITGNGTTNVNTGTTTINTSLAQGTVNVGNASTPSDAALINKGTVNATDMNVNTANSSYTNNTGKTTTLTGTLTNKGTVTNNGTLSANSLDNQKTITGTGNMALTSGGSNSGTGASITQNNIDLNGGTFNNGADMTANGKLTNKGTLNNTSNVTANTLDNDSVISGAGNLKVVAGGSSDGVISQATVELTGGAFDNNSNITTTGTFKNGATLDNTATITSGGAFTNTGVITTDTAGKGTIIAQAGGSSTAAITQAVLDFAGGSFDNDANMTATTSFTVESGASLDNSAKILAQTFTNAGTVSDASGNGVLEVTAGGSASGNTTQKDITLQGGTFDNTGTMTSTGTFTNHATVSGNAGTLNAKNGSSDKAITQGTIAITGAFNNDADMTAKTLLDIDSAAVLTNDATITAAKFENDGTITQETTAGGTVKIAGTGSYNKGTITQTLVEVTGGTFTNDTTGKILASAGTGTTTVKVDSGAAEINKGEIGTSSKPVATVQNDGTFTNDTTGNVYATTLDNNSTMTNKHNIVATTVENDGAYTNDGATSSIIATTINNNTGSFTNDGAVGSTTTPVTTLNNSATFTNNSSGVVLATTIDNKSGGTYTNSGKTGTAANPVTTITNNGTAFVNNGGASVVATNVTNNTSMTNKASGTIDSVNYTNNKTLANNGTINSTGTFTNAAAGTIGNGGTEGEGTINVVNGSNAGAVTQGNFTIAAGNTGFTNDKTMTIETALNNNGKFNNTDTVNVQNSTNNAAFTNAGTYTSTGAASQAKTNADNVINTGGTMNLTKSDIVVGYQAGDIMGTINIKGTSVADTVNLDVQGADPDIGGTVNVGSSTETATANLKAGNIIETAALSVASGSVLNVDNSAAPTAPTSVVVNTNDTYSGDITLAAGDVTLKDVSVATGDTSTTAGGTKPYYAQTGGNLLLDNSTMSMANAAKISGGNMNVNDTSTYIAESGAFNVNTLQNSGLVQVINGGYDNYGMNNLVVGSATDTQGDFTADLYARSNTNKKYDSYGDSSTVISAGNASLNGTVNISDWKLNGNLMGKDAPIDREIYFNNMFAGSVNPGDTINFTATNKKVFTPIGNYRVSHAGGGTFKLELADYNPQVFRGQVTKLAQYQNQLAIDDMLFTHSMTLPSFKDEDGGMSKAMMANRYAGAGDLYAPYQYSRKDGGLWFKSYGNFEHLNMSHGLDVGNNGYGSLIGADFGLKELKNGWKFMPTAYIGYNGAHQYFNRVSAYQNGGQLGLMGTWYKDNFLIGVLGYAGLYNNHMTVKNYSSEDSLGYFAGGSVKTAYNWRVHKDVVIQPNIMAAYNFFGKENWHTDFGQMGMMSGMLHGINIAPGINLIWEKETFSTYLTVQYMYNVNQSLGGRAGNVYLPRVAMDRGYIQYGIGATKKMTDRVSGYAQAVFRNAGRTGVGFQAGLEILLGKSNKK